jgi:hypothetical protein
MTQKVNMDGWETKTEKHLINCSESTTKEFDKIFVESLLEDCGSKTSYLP